MRFPWVNTALLFIVLLQIASGFLGFTAWNPPEILFQLHGISGFALVILLGWKGIIILDSYRRNLKLGTRRFGFFALTLALLAILVTGLLWTWDGPINFQGSSLLTWHVVLAVAVLGLFAWHTWYMRFILKSPASRDRRMILRTGMVGLGGLALWRSAGLLKTILAVQGAVRRRTGSYETGSFTGVFPGVIWIADRVEPIAEETWQLELDGAVRQPRTLSLDALVDFPVVESTATLDCTGGWYTTQVWSGVRLLDVLATAGITSSAKSVSVISVSGYSRRFSIADLGPFLLASHVAGEPLPHIHGSPLRLVAPGYRGFAWVKWVTRLRLNETRALWQPPLPLQ